MKKDFEEPLAEIIRLSGEDMITSSPTGCGGSSCDVETSEDFF